MTPAKACLNRVHVEAISMQGAPRPDTRVARIVDRVAQSSSTEHRLPPLQPEATLELLDRVRRGDDEALEALFIRCLPALRRWARGRLPVSARGMQDTADLVQDTLLATLRRLNDFDARHQGALLAYLRQAIMNRIRDMVRQRDRRPVRA